MKIKISTIIEIPDNELLKGNFRWNSAVQVVFDAITNYVGCCHFRDATKWCAKAKVKDDDDPLPDKDSETYSSHLTYKYHNFWGNTCDKLEWKYEELKEK